jgi:hypothetical protein
MTNPDLLAHKKEIFRLLYRNIKAAVAKTTENNKELASGAAI